MDGSGASRTVRRGDPDHDGTVVGLGALGIVTTLTLDVEPTYDVRQDVWTDLPYAAVADHFDEITASGYSVSLFTDFSDAGFAQAWVKSRATEAPTEFFGARPATKQLHPDIGAVAEGVTQQGGIVGPWLERLPHFRLEFTPSHGAELQGEYLVPRGAGPGRAGRLPLAAAAARGSAPGVRAPHRRGRRPLAEQRLRPPTSSGST